MGTTAGWSGGGGDGKEEGVRGREKQGEML